MKIRNLWQRLASEGYTGTPERFKQAVIDEYVESVCEPMGWSVDELLMHPDYAVDYCKRVRSRLGFDGVSYPLVLRTLAQIRKRGGGEVSVKEVATA